MQVISPERMYLIRKTRVEGGRLLKKYGVVLRKMNAAAIVHRNISKGVEIGIMEME